MKKKKLLSVLLAGAMSASIFVGCGSSATDWDYISNKGELVIGVTYFEPMNYLDADGKLTGFETEFAEAVCEKWALLQSSRKLTGIQKRLSLTQRQSTASGTVLQLMTTEVNNGYFNSLYGKQAGYGCKI